MLLPKRRQNEEKKIEAQTSVLIVSASANAFVKSEVARRKVYGIFCARMLREPDTSETDLAMYLCNDVLFELVVFSAPIEAGIVRCPGRELHEMLQLGSWRQVHQSHR